MARKTERNDAYVGTRKLYELASEGVSNLSKIKYPNLFEEYEELSHPTSYFRYEPLKFVGLDVETEVMEEGKKGQMKLITFNLPDNRYKTYYRRSTEYMTQKVANMLYCCSKNKQSLVYYREFDGIAILRLFLEYANLTDLEKMKALEKFPYLQGEYDEKELKDWKVKPVVRIQNMELLCEADQEQGLSVKGEVGIRKGLKGSIEFYVLTDEEKEAGKRPSLVWAYDVSTHWKKPLDKIMPELGYTWYSKLGEEYHLVDWNRCRTDKEYAKGVYTSNCLDARAARILAEQVQNHFYKIFKFYPNSLISGGSLTQSAIAVILRKDPEAFESLNHQVIKRNWVDNGYTQEDVKKLEKMAYTSYSAGLIEALQLGYSKEMNSADISSAYPSIMKFLLDLRNSTIKTGKGKPTERPDGIRYIFGTVFISGITDDMMHTIPVKDLQYSKINTRPSGSIRTTALYEEIDLLERQGALVEWEEYALIETTGEHSPYYKVVDKLWRERLRLRKEKNPAEEVVKTVLASMYGKTLESFRNYSEKDDRPRMEGLKGGKFLNIFYGSIICAFVRIKLIEAARNIVKNEGTPVLFMTDSISFKGGSLDRDFDTVLDANGWRNYKSGWREYKALGYFEKPETVTEFFCLSAGQYEYIKPNGERHLRTRGFKVKGKAEVETNVVHQEETLYNIVQNATAENFGLTITDSWAQNEITVKQDVFVGTHHALIERNFDLLGQVLKDEAYTFDPTKIYPKRMAAPFTLWDLLEGLVETYPLNNDAYGLEYFDGTLEVLDEHFTGNTVKSSETKNKEKKEKVKQAQVKSKGTRDALLKQIGITDNQSRKNGIRYLKKYGLLEEGREKQFLTLDELRTIIEKMGKQPEA